MLSNCAILQDNSGTIEREEFLSLPQINSNPLATRCVQPKCNSSPVGYSNDEFRLARRVLSALLYFGY